MVIFGVFWLFVAVVILAFSVQKPVEVHEHADFAVYINGARYNFTHEKYMSDENKTLSEFSHLHGMNGHVIHKHAAGVTLGYFFATLGIRFNSTCFVLENGTSYCNSGDNTVQLFVNGNKKIGVEFCDDGISDCEKIIDFVNAEYEFHDLDRILIAYGNYTAGEIASMIDSVSDEACIFSGKCPERGTPPPESCAGGICEQ